MARRNGRCCFLHCNSSTLGIGGVQLFKAEVPGPVASKITPRVRETAKLLWIVYVGFTLLQTIALLLAGVNLFDSICHSFTTIATGGFSTKNESIAYFNNSAVHYIIIFFMFISGVNFSLHFRAISGDFKIYFRDLEFIAYLLIIFFVTSIIFYSISSFNGNFSIENFRESFFATVCMLTGTGFVLEIMKCGQYLFK